MENIFSDYNGETSPKAFKKKKTIGKFFIGILLKFILLTTKTILKTMKLFKLIYSCLKFVYHLPAEIILFCVGLIGILFSKKFKDYIISSTTTNEQKDFTKKMVLMTNILSFAFWSFFVARLIIKKYL